MVEPTSDTVAHEAERLTRRPTAYALAARRLTHLAGSVQWIVILAVLTTTWMIVGAVAGFPRWWELAVTVGFPFLTLGVLALAQHTQNHDSNAIELKLDELIASMEGASDSMLRVEEASEHDLERLQDHFGDRRR